MVVVCALMIFFLAALSFSWNNAIAQRSVVLGICLLAIYEAALGISQVFGHSASHHSLFALTGTLSNPGPYGGLMAVVFSVAFAQSQKEARPLIPLIAALASLIVLPASMSRAAWLATGAAVGVWAFRERNLWEWLKGHKAMTLFLAVLFALLLTCFFYLKPSSAMGRLHIWHMDLLAIAEKPLWGWGIGKRAFAFGEVQANYFSEASRPSSIVALSCCPEESFNEYLSLAVELGVPALAVISLILYAAVYRLFKKDSPLAYGLIAWLVFAFFSYPLSVKPMVALLSIFLGAAFSVGGHARCRTMCFSMAGLVVSALLFLNGVDGHRQRDNALECYRFAKLYMKDGTYDIAVESLEPLYETLDGDFRYLYDYGYSLHKSGQYEKSNAVLSRGASLSCDPMFHDIIGKNHEALGHPELAEKEFLHARDMVPCRLYPYILLMEMYASRKDTLSAVEYSRAALSLPVNPHHSGMLELHDRAGAFLERAGVR